MLRSRDRILEVRAIAVNLPGLNATRFQVDHVNVAAVMEAPNVRADVRGLLGAVLAVRALESRILPALVLQMLLQIVLPVEDALAVLFRAGEPDFLSFVS